MEIRNTAVLGAGTMGASIAVALANSGYPVLLKDVNQAALDSGNARIDRFFKSLVKKGLSEEEAAEKRKLITTQTGYDNFNHVDIAIEAVLEDMNVKRMVFQELEHVCRREAILASNTSGLSLTQIASFTKSPDRVVGTHFFNPAHIMNLVEVIAALNTSEEAVETTLTFARSLGKLAVRVQECPSFLVNRLLGRYMNEALWCLEEGVSIEDIDKAATEMGMPIGPLALRDMNGADIGLAVASYNHAEYGDRYRPSGVLSAMVKKNLLGQKTGKGFYLYDAETKKRTEPNTEIQDLAVGIRNSEGKWAPFTPQRLFLPMINEAFMTVQERICAPEELDPAMESALNMKQGPFKLANEIGLANCLVQMQKHYEIYGERFRPAPLLKRYVWGKRTTAP
jgi:3-hydroxyacyl-CoA dehydrogenase